MNLYKIEIYSEVCSKWIKFANCFTKGNVDGAFYVLDQMHPRKSYRAINETTKEVYREIKQSKGVSNYAL